ncbi:hypothetical protein AAD018_010905 [Aestuariibius insulae]|uniref:hypothetical protein n=1 Tax=Aestuariibius insulae TaxID=2058287 RepID=UPI00345E827B
MSLTLELWTLVIGAACGIGGALVARGRNRLIKAAGAGAVMVVLVPLIREFL